MIESLWQTLIYMITRPCNRPEDLNISQCKQLFITEALNAKFNRKIDKLFKVGKARSDGNQPAPSKTVLLY